MIEAHIKDKIERAERHWTTEVTDFLPVEQAATVVDMIAKTELYYTVWGGYQEAERVQVAFQQMLAPSIQDFPIVLISFSGHEKFLQGSHRDWLGALMSLGFTREKLGDILIRKDGADIFVDAALAPYILQQSLKIRNVPIKGKVIAYQDWQKPEIKKKELTLLVQSPRLDAIIAKSYGLNRKKTALLIEKEQVQINHSIALKPSQVVKIDDLISVHGYGRLRVIDFLGKTKKEKYKIHIWRYL